MVTPQQLDNAAQCAREYVSSGNLAMAAVAASDDEGLRLRVAFGKDGEEYPDLCDRQYALASISKAITGVLTAILYEQGILDYEAPIIEYVPEFGTSAARRSIRLGQVFNHSTGLGSRFIDSCVQVDYDPVRMLDQLCTAPLEDEPGTASRYSTHTFQLIVEAIKRRLELSMEEALQRFLCEPCGMRDTSFYPRPEIAMEVLDHPVPEGAQFLAIQKMEMAGGGLWSTLDDLTRLGRAWLACKLVSPETFAKVTALWNPLPIVDGGGVLCRRTLGFDRALGCFPNQPESGFFHGGATGTLWYMDPERDLVYVFLTNRWGASNEQAFSVLGRLYA